jgi:hypothetical protein
MEINGENVMNVISMIGEGNPDHQKSHALIGGANHHGYAPPPLRNAT